MDCGTGAALKGSLSWLDVVEPVFRSSVPGLRAQLVARFVDIGPESRWDQRDGERRQARRRLERK